MRANLEIAPGTRVFGQYSGHIGTVEQRGDAGLVVRWSDGGVQWLTSVTFSKEMLWPVQSLNHGDRVVWAGREPIHWYDIGTIVVTTTPSGDLWGVRWDCDGEIDQITPYGWMSTHKRAVVKFDPTEPAPKVNVKVELVGWSVLSCIRTDAGNILSVVAARDCDGTGEVASWSRDAEGKWKLDGWGCTEDHAGHADDCEDDLLPDAPPFRV